MQTITLQVRIDSPDNSVNSFFEQFMRIRPIEGIRSDSPEVQEKQSKEAFPEKILINRRQTAKLLNVSEKTLYNLEKEGLMPKSIKLGTTTVRWNYEELRAWAAEGCPHRNNWHFDRASLEQLK